MFFSPLIVFFILLQGLILNGFYNIHTLGKPDVEGFFHCNEGTLSNLVFPKHDVTFSYSFWLYQFFVLGQALLFLL